MIVIILMTLVFLFVATYIFKLAQAVLSKNYAVASRMIWRLCSIGGDTILTMSDSRLCTVLAGDKAGSEAWQRFQESKMAGDFKLRAYIHAQRGEWSSALETIRQGEAAAMELVKGELPPPIQAELAKMLDAVERQDGSDLFRAFSFDRDVKELEKNAKIVRIASIVLALLAIGIAYLAITAPLPTKK